MQINRRQTLILGATLPALALTANASFAASSPRIYAERGIAIDGSDPVAYFTEGKPVAGSKTITHKWMGATWRFASEANKVTFIADPTAYAPQYGGYCAWAVGTGNGSLASTIPTAWKIVDGKLYLNYSHRIQRRWDRDIPGFIKRANENWPKVLG